MHRLRYCCTPEIHKVTKYRACHQLGAKTNSSADPADPDYPDYQVSSTAARNLPTTRAGGQDDVSSQANSLKLAAIWHWSLKPGRVEVGESVCICQTCLSRKPLSTHLALHF